MLEILHFVFSSFSIWLGCFLMLAVFTPVYTPYRKE